MGNYPILTAIVVAPILGAMLVLLTPARRPELARAIGLMVSMATLGFALLLLWKFRSNFGGVQYRGPTGGFVALGVG